MVYMKIHFVCNVWFQKLMTEKISVGRSWLKKVSVVVRTQQYGVRPGHRSNDKCHIR